MALILLIVVGSFVVLALVDALIWTARVRRAQRRYEMEWRNAQHKPDEETNAP
jgi:hypothetical protein